MMGAVAKSSHRLKVDAKTTFNAQDFLDSAGGRLSPIGLSTGGKLLISRVIGQVAQSEFHLSGNGVNQDLAFRPQ
jgi:hypothetical protein